MQLDKNFWIGVGLGFVSGLIFKVALPLVIIIAACAVIYAIFNKDTNR